MGQLPQALGIVAQAPPGIPQRLVELLQVGIDPVAEVALAHFVPHQFDRVEFRGVGRKVQQGEVVRHAQGMTFVPSSPVEDEQHVAVGVQAAAEFVELDLQGLRVGRRHDPGIALSAGWTDRTKEVEPLVLGLARGARAATSLGPDAAVAALLAKACLVLEPDFQLALRMPGLNLDEPFAQ